MLPRKCLRLIWCGSYVHNWKSFIKIWTLWPWIVFHYSTIVSGVPNLTIRARKNLIVQLHVKVITFHLLWPFREMSIILSLHWTGKIYMQPWWRSARNFTGGVFATIARLIHDFVFSPLSLSLFGNKQLLVKAFIVTISEWPEWKYLYIF